MRQLLFSTLGFPGDLYSEKAFIEPEIKALRDKFDRIILFPTDRFPRESGYADALPEGVTVDWSLADDTVFHSRLLKAVYILHPFVWRALVMMRGEARGVRQWLKGFYQAVNSVRIGYLLKRLAARNGMTPANTVFYSMWFADTATAMARLALQQGWKVATRAHTSDLYDERQEFRSRRLRARMLDGIRRVICISDKGAQYLKNRYPSASARISARHLGSSGPDVLTGKESRANSSGAAGSDRSEEVRFVTVARLDPVKQLSLIMETLAELTLLLGEKRIMWTLIGDGECMDMLHRQAEELSRRVPSFTVDFCGALSNADVHRYYSEEGSDWFILMSRTEGMPVSMGEAMSHGIPVISTDVGDVSELTGEDSALLLPPGLTPREYARMIACVAADECGRQMKGEAARRRWEDSFNAAALADATAVDLDSLLL